MNLSPRLLPGTIIGCLLIVTAWNELVFLRILSIIFLIVVLSNEILEDKITDDANAVEGEQ